MSRTKRQTETSKAPTTPAHAETLNGSGTLPAEIDIAEGRTVQLGEIVMKAHARSGLPVDAWNALPGDDRDALLLNEIEHARSKAVLSASSSETSVQAVSNGSQAPLEPSSQQAAEAADQSAERVFEVLSRVKRNGVQLKTGDSITLDRADFEELKRFRVVAGTFELGKPVEA